MEKQPKIKIGDQKFERVGEMKSERMSPDSKLQVWSSADPHSFELYQDTESGSLVGLLPKDHRVVKLTQKLSQEAGERSAKDEVNEQLEAIDLVMDLTSLSPYEAKGILTRHLLQNFPPEVIDKNFSIYGKINGGKEGELFVFQESWDPAIIFYKDDIIEVKEAWTTMRKNIGTGLRFGRPSEWDKALLKLPHVEITTENIKITGKNRLIIAGNDSSFNRKEINRSADVSFLEVPLGYKELMEKKEKK